jgi:hypothetical protein
MLQACLAYSKKLSDFNKLCGEVEQLEVSYISVNRVGCHSSSSVLSSLTSRQSSTYSFKQMWLLRHTSIPMHGHMAPVAL